MNFNFGTKTILVSGFITFILGIMFIVHAATLDDNKRCTIQIIKGVICIIICGIFLHLFIAGK